jgi:hypothetical protein
MHKRRVRNLIGLRLLLQQLEKKPIEKKNKNKKWVCRFVWENWWRGRIQRI